LASIEDKLRLVNKKFRRGSKTYEAARYIVRHNRELDENEREAICKETGIRPKTLYGILSKLKKLNLYDPYGDLEAKILNPEIASNSQENLEYSPLEQEEEIDSQEEEENIVEKYATIEDLNSLRDGLQSSFNKLASVILGEPETEEEEAYINDKLIEIATPDDMLIGDPSLTRKSVWLKPKTQMYFDLTRQGFFTNYSGSNEVSVLSGFKGNLSDFVNSIIDDYFVRNYNADIGVLARRYI